jgi:putative cell wall-binding protein
MILQKDDNDFFKQIEDELIAEKYEKLQYLKNKIKNCLKQAENLPVENSAYTKKEIIPALKNEYYKTYLELKKKEDVKTNTKSTT